MSSAMMKEAPALMKVAYSPSGSDSHTDDLSRFRDSPGDALLDDLFQPLDRVPGDQGAEVSTSTTDHGNVLSDGAKSYLAKECKAGMAHNHLKTEIKERKGGKLLEYVMDVIDIDCPVFEENLPAVNFFLIQKSFQDLLLKRVGNRSLWKYPFAGSCVNITFMLIQMLDLQAAKPRTMMGAQFLKILAEDKRAFDLLYCITFIMMDHQWLTMQAPYMDFDAVMKATWCQLEREFLLEDIQRLHDMPSFRLLVL